MSTKLYGVLLLCGLPLAAADVSGHWKISGTVGEYPINLNCAFKTNAASLTGICKGGDRPDRAVTGEVSGQKVHFQYEIEYDGNKMTVSYSGVLQSDTSMKGSVEVSGTSGEFTATKASD
jgi:hypothetical protein